MHSCGCISADDTKDDWVYLMNLHLQDATGELDAALFDKDANDFFQVSCFNSVMWARNSSCIPVLYLLC